MKRISRINSEHPQKSQTYSLKRFAGARRSEKGSDATTSIEIEPDTSTVKRVRLSNSDANHCSNAKPSANSVLREATKAARSDAPKTSKFAFFKKIKQKACSAPYHSHKEDNSWDDVKSRESRRETPILFEQGRSNLKSSLPVDKVRPINQHYFASPSDDASRDLGLKNVEPICKIITPQQPSDKLEPCRYNWFSPPFAGGLRNTESQYSDRGVFSTKRRKLWQLVANTSLPKVDELSSKGSSLVSALLSRLFPENNVERDCRNPKSRDAEKDIEQEQTLLPRPETHVNRLHKQAHKMNLNVSKHRPYIDDGFGMDWSRRHRDNILESDTICSDPPSTSYSAKTLTDYSYSRSICDVDQMRISSLWRHSESFEGYDSFPCVHLKDRECLLDYKQPKSRPQPQTLLLGWDVNNEKHKQKMVAPSFLNDVNSFSMLESKWADDHNDHGTYSELISLSSSFSKDSRNLPLSPHYHLDSLSFNDFQSHIGEKKYQGALTLSGTPKYLKLVGDSIAENMLESSGIELPYRDDVREEVCGSLEPFLFPTRLDFASGWKFLSMADSFEKHSLTNDAFWFLQKEGLLSFTRREDDDDNCLYCSNYLVDSSGCPLTVHDRSLSNSKLSLDNDIGKTNYPLVLHDPSWDRCEEESYRDYNDDGIDEWKYV